MTHALVPPPPSPPARTGSPEQVSPYRWLLVGRSPQWREAARDFIAQQVTPMAIWRRSHGLVQVLPPSELAPALHAALAARPRLTRVLVEPGLVDQVKQNLRAQLSRVQPPPLRLGTLAAPFETLRTSLAQAEGLAAEQWLLSGRQHWPHYDWPGADAEACAAAGAAFRTWAADLLKSMGSDALDDIYGTGTELELVDQTDDDADAPTAPLSTVPGLPLPRKMPRPMRLAAAASGAAPGSLSAWIREGSVQGHPEDRYLLQVDPLASTSGYRSGQVAMKITLTLDATRWKGRQRVVLELHQHRHLPLQCVLGDVQDEMAEPGASITLHGSLQAPASLLKANAGELALWLRFEDGTTPTWH